MRRKARSQTGRKQGGGVTASVNPQVAVPDRSRDGPLLKYVRNLALFLVQFSLFAVANLVVSLSGKRFGAHNIVSFDPSGGPDRKAGLGPGGEITRGLIVAAQEGGLGRGQIGLRIVTLAAIGHRELHVADRRLGLARG